MVWSKACSPAFCISGFGGSLDWFLNVKDWMQDSSAFQIAAEAKSPVLTIVQSHPRMRHRALWIPLLLRAIGRPLRNRGPECTRVEAGKAKAVGLWRGRAN
jgi:hypothetical protein